MLIRATILLFVLSIVSLGGTKENHTAANHEPAAKEEVKTQLIEFTDPLVITPSR